jgi:uncharacterized protein (TIGR00369 family)
VREASRGWPARCPRGVARYHKRDYKIDPMKTDEEAPTTVREPVASDRLQPVAPETPTELSQEAPLRSDPRSSQEPPASRSEPARRSEQPRVSQRAARRISDSQVTLHQLMMPEHANNYGHVHGGIIVKLADEAAAICAMRHARRPVVTVAIDSMSFRSPVHTGMLVSITATINYAGRTSMEIEVKVLAEDPITGTITHTNSAYFVFVALDDNGKPTVIPPLELSDDDQRRRFKEGEERQRRRRLAEQLTRG